MQILRVDVVDEAFEDLDSFLLEKKTVEESLAMPGGALRVQAFLGAHLRKLLVICACNGLLCFFAMFDNCSHLAMDEQISVASNRRCEMSVQREIEAIVRNSLALASQLIDDLISTNGHILCRLQRSKEFE